MFHVELACTNTFVTYIAGQASIRTSDRLHRERQSCAGKTHAPQFTELTTNWKLPSQLPTSSSALVELAAPPAVVLPHLPYAGSSLDCLPSCIPSAFLRFLLVGNVNDE